MTSSPTQASSASSPTPVRRLDGDEGGRWLITTESGSTYMLDLTQMTARRTNGEWQMRRDGEELVLWSLVRCTVGVGAIMNLSVSADVEWTSRYTTSVVSIRAAP